MRLRHLALALVAVGAALAFIPSAFASVLIEVDKSAQRMTVSVDGIPRYQWPVSTGIAAYDTPEGEFKPFRMEKDHFSREWDDAPMPYSIFFTQQGHAIHGTNHKTIGRPASHGCVRLSVENAATLFALVEEQGMSKTRVELNGEIPETNAPAVARREPRAAPYGDDDDGFTGALAPRRYRSTRGWREYSEGPVYYYERVQPRRERRYYRDYRYNDTPYPYWR